MLKLFVINGPNFNLLERRDSLLYGGLSLEDLISYTQGKLESHPVELNWFQSNHEGEIIEIIHQAIEKKIDGIVINPGGFSHTSVAIHDALEIFPNPVVEVHLTNTTRRENFRSKKITARAVNSILEGHGKNSYVLAISSFII